MPRGGSRPGAGRPRKNPVAEPAPAKKRPVAKKSPAGHAPDGVKTPEAPPSWPFGADPPAPPQDLSKLTPLEYMLQVMRDPNEEKGRRMQAASLAAPYVHAKKGELGKKQQAAEDAKAAAASGRFSRRQPPKLVAAGGKKLD